ncbi:MAG TPA: hypothetical protein VM686_42265 [Polyangiaceae bacterium]|nr:hypothetical protein [Polyangiaceae bacterium]
MMTEMDALRLRVAARAYRATRPAEAEVEHGVRRALSAMRRSQIRRRASLAPAIIVAILAFGTLAYANPNHIRSWVATMLLSTRESVRREVGAQLYAVKAARPPVEPAVAAAPPTESTPENSPQAAAAPATEPAPASEPMRVVRPASSKSQAQSQTTSSTQRATWAEVNSALAGQDTPRALSALGDLSRHGDSATRAKAQLGVAQLLWSRGDRGTACSIAKTLIQQKSTPARVQERARALVQGCKP